MADAMLGDRGSEERARIFLHPGGLFVSAESHAVVTILGSCVAVCLVARQQRLGGMNHYQMPFRGPFAGPEARFGEVSLAALVRGLEGLGAVRRNLVAMIFGGASVVPTSRPESESIGARNVEVARTFLERERILVLHEDVGGRKGRRVVFHTDSGEAWSRMV